MESRDQFGESRSERMQSWKQEMLAKIVETSKRWSKEAEMNSSFAEIFAKVKKNLGEEPGVLLQN